MQVDRLTYFENCFLVTFNDGEIAELNELDVGVEKMNHMLMWFGIEHEWYGKLETAGPGQKIVLFCNEVQNKNRTD